MLNGGTGPSNRLPLGKLSIYTFGISMRQPARISERNQSDFKKRQGLPL